MESTSVWKRIFGSSKNIMMLAAVIFALVGRVGLHLEMELIISVLTLVAIAIGARAAEDVAKANAIATRSDLEQLAKAVQPDTTDKINS